MSAWIWRDYLILLSFVSCIAGLGLLLQGRNTSTNEVEETDSMLFMMSFTYWMVYCLAVGIQKMTLPQWDVLLLSVKLTAAISYVLTFTCVLSLPLHRLAVRQPTQ